MLPLVQPRCRQKKLHATLGHILLRLVPLRLHEEKRPRDALLQLGTMRQQTQILGRLCCRCLECKPRRGTNPLEARIKRGTARCPSPLGGVRRESGVVAVPKTRIARRDDAWWGMSRRDDLACASWVYPPESSQPA